MKKCFLILLAVVLSISAYAQSEHLTFKGVPIDGSLKQFVSKMVSAGFTSMGIKDGSAGLKGDFAGHKDCVVVVSTLQNKDLVSHIDVLFPEKETWSALEGNYYELKNMLTTKYGKPAKVIEKFDGYVGDSGSLKIVAVRTGDCNYHTVFSTEKGEIVLQLDSFDYECHVVLSYYDRINDQEVETAAMDDL